MSTRPRSEALTLPLAHYSADIRTILRTSPLQRGEEEAVDLTHPIRAAIPSLDGPVLEVLARTTRPLTGREVHRLVGVGSENGVRAVLTRLASQGVVLAEARAKAVFYTLNREHLAASAIESLANLRNALVERLRSSIAAWNEAPAHASLFGSVARDDGSVDSDVDLLLVRATRVMATKAGWLSQMDRLARDVHAWTGNHLQIYELSRRELSRHVTAREPIVESWRRDAITLYGPDLTQLLRRLA
jgi:predicted nucleotidyltransferase